MRVQCPRCATEYRVPEGRITDARPVFRCTHCAHVFSIESPPPSRPRPKARDRNLELDFNSDDDRSAAPDDADADRAARPAARRSAPTTGRAGGGRDAGEDFEAGSGPAFAGPEEADEPLADSRPRSRASARDQDDEASDPAEVSMRRRRGDDTDEDFRLGGAEPARGRVSRPTGSRQPPSFADEFVDEPDGADDGGDVLLQPRQPRRRRPIEPRARRRSPSNGREARSPLRPVAIGVGAVVAGWGLLSLVATAEPTAAMRWLRDTPLLGRLLGDDHLLAWRIQLDGIEGSYDQIKGNRRVYVVTGRAVNASTQNVRLIEIEGRLLVGDREARRLVVYAANQFRKTIKGLAAGEVEMLLHLEPNKRFAVKPGESAGFLLVFADPPAGVTDVACKVVAAAGA